MLIYEGSAKELGLETGVLCSVIEQVSLRDSNEWAIYWRCGMQAFHSIVWRQGRSPVEREVSALKNLSEVIASAESRAGEICKRFPGKEPDGFDVYDAIGRLVAIRKI